jgi:glycosyltransferase involved in cell wall biosynthesis
VRVLYDARLAGRGLGIARFATQLAAALIATGRIELVWLGDPGLAPAGAASSLALNRRPYPLLDGPAGRGLARRLGADAIHFTGNTGWGRRGPIASVLTVHDLIFLDSGSGPRSLRQRAGHRYETWLVPRAVASCDVIVVPSRTVAEQLRDRLPAAHEPRVVYEGVAPRPLPTVTGGPPTPYLLAFAGRDPRKNTRAVVEAWRLLADAHLDLKLLASGGLPPGLRTELAGDLTAGRVEIHPHLQEAQLWRLLEGAFALIYPSTAEGFGLPVLEGMAAGTPVLSGIAAATREIGGDAIIPLDAADIPGSIAAAIRRLVDNPAEADAVRRRGAARAREFTWEATAAGYLQAYEHAIAAF